MDTEKFRQFVESHTHKTSRMGKSLVYQEAGIVKLKPKMRVCKLCGHQAEDPCVIYNLMRRTRSCGLEPQKCQGNPKQRKQRL